MEGPTVSELCDLGAGELRRLIGAGEVSPVEVLASCAARIEAVNPVLNAIVAMDPEAAMQEARAAEAAVRRGDRLGPLHGLPIGIKDLNETAGLRTTLGSRLFADHVPDQDEPLVADIRAAGAVVLGKTNTPEFGAGANTVNDVYGFTGNPFDPGRSCAGSSGGSAVALATGMVPLATGSDLGGSLRTPAAYCGVVGFRSTPGLIGDPTKRFAWWPLSVEGPMARNVEDLALLLSVMAGERAGDALSWPGERPDFLKLPESDLSRARVAVSADLGFAPLDDDLRRVFAARAEEVSGLFAAADWADPPLRGATRAFEVLRGIGFVAGYRTYFEERPDDLGPNVTANVALGLGLNSVDVAEAMKTQSELYRAFADFMAPYDALICPTASVSPIAKGELYPTEINGQPLETYISWLAITYGLTLIGHPVVVLPCGLDHRGMPFGIQVVGKFGRDRELLGLARSLEAALAGSPAAARPRPDLDRLASSDPA
jgi:Asp-tRNA(Asn)/Glu-tRNA(Gln) amidotransferase A subunit family amidase